MQAELENNTAVILHLDHPGLSEIIVATNADLRKSNEYQDQRR